MPKDLPGFYFDESRDRYFPVSSRPQEKAADFSPQNLREVPKKKRRLDVAAGIPFGATWCQRERMRSEIVSAHVQASSRVQESTVNTFGTITAFCMTRMLNSTRGIMGDDRGWIYTYTSENENPEVGTIAQWSPELNIQNACEISSICISGNKCVATSHGNWCKILVQDMTSSEIFLLNVVKSMVRDVWTSHLLGRHLVIGANSKAVFLSDIDTTRSVLTLDTKSDVFAVHQLENLVYTGLRNGQIAYFDLRVDRLRGFKLFDSRFNPSQLRSSVTYLTIIRDHQLLVSHMNGNLAAYDLRFPRSSTPVLSFAGHVNSYTQRLGVAIDPNQDFIFAAGQDDRIRAWSLRTGEPLYPPLNSPWLSPPHQQDAPFPAASDRKPVSLLQITEEREGLLLWSLSGINMRKCWIGHI